MVIRDGTDLGRIRIWRRRIFVYELRAEDDALARRGRERAQLRDLLRHHGPSRQHHTQSLDTAPTVRALRAREADHLPPPNISTLSSGSLLARVCLSLLRRWSVQNS
ncbi:hypothetical protein EVAR_45866_1 [Eumeta japonica]|uniref:Uncharacterized protein n=1 Tax=Eumeta variegata TaxID=151549 RepID=A0A4C1WKN7_EUMVA|nr:hypothetical protein EVAR_45866_1 [Eumeta japonica]